MISAGRSKGSTANKSPALTASSFGAIPSRPNCIPQLVNSSGRYFAL